MIKAVLFDYGGVLTNAGRSVRHDIAKALGVADEELQFDDMNEKFRTGKIDSKEFFTELNSRYKGDGTLESKLLDNPDFYRREEKIYHLAEELRSLDIKTSIFSNVYQPSADRLRKVGNYEGFDPLILSCEVGYAKPDERFYQRALDLLKLRPEEILLIDDQDKCLVPARKMGMKVIKSVSTEQVLADAKALFAKENNMAL